MQKLSDPSQGERLADSLAAFVGSWKFLVMQSFLVLVWITYNLLVITGSWHFDPYPFIFLNLIFSLQAAYTAPVVMISQNRQDQRDRVRDEQSYQTTVLLRQEIAELHRKIDQLPR